MLIHTHICTDDQSYRYKTYKSQRVGVVFVDIHIHTQEHKHTLPYTPHSSLYTCTSTRPHPINPMCVHMQVSE